MEQLFIDKFPKEKGDYLVMFPDDIKALKITDFTSDHCIAESDGVKYMIEKKTWKVSKIEGDKAFPIGNALAIRTFRDCIDRDVDLDMMSREELRGRILHLTGPEDEHVILKILDPLHHLHTWTLFNVEDMNTHKHFQVQVTDRDTFWLDTGNGWKRWTIMKDS